MSDEVEAGNSVDDSPAATSIFKFWSTQPVLTDDDFEKPIEQGTIINVELAKVPKEPYKLPEGLEWINIDSDDPKQIVELQEFIHLNYVEDTTSSFRLSYSTEFIVWALKGPEWAKNWNIGVRLTENKNLVAFICGVPDTIRIYDKTVEAAKVNFLCVNKKIRKRRLTPFLIKELTRVINLSGIYVAIFTSGEYIPTPMCVCRYYHRIINTEKLIKTSFANVKKNGTLEETIRSNILPKVHPLEGFRLMRKKDVLKVRDILNAYYSKSSDLIQVFTKSSVNNLLTKEKVIYSYVVEEDGKITDFISFFCISTFLMNNDEYSSLEIAYLYYFAPKYLGDDIKRLTDLVMCALIETQKILQLPQTFESLKFRRGDGLLNYNFYNYKSNKIKNSRNGLIVF